MATQKTAPKSSSSRRGVTAKVLPSRKQVREAIDTGMRTVKERLLAADESMRAQVEQLAERLAAQLPAKGLHDLASELQARLAQLKDVLPTGGAKGGKGKSGVRAQVRGGLSSLRKRAKKAVRRPRAGA